MWKITNLFNNEAYSAPSFRRLPIGMYFPGVGFSDAVDETFTFEDEYFKLYWEAVPVPEPLPETTEQARLRAKSAIDAHIQKMVSPVFDSIITAAYRAALPDSRWHVLGKALGNWSEACWAAADDFEEVVKGQLEAGTRTAFPTNEEVINALPIFQTP
jgi:hypothetical protein